jgi:cholesterol transport system auxiliary component
MKRQILILIVAFIFCGCASGPAWKRQSFTFSVPGNPSATNASETIAGLTHVSISPMFGSRSFTYRTGENSYEQDPYASFLIPPERALAESIRAWMSASGVFGRVVEPGSDLTPSLIVEISINELYGDFRNPSRPLGTMGIHIMCYEKENRAPRRVILDKYCSHETPLSRKTPGALMAAWDTDLREIMNQINSEYAKTNSNNG